RDTTIQSQCGNATRERGGDRVEARAQCCHTLSIEVPQDLWSKCERQVYHDAHWHDVPVDDWIGLVDRDEERAKPEAPCDKGQGECSPCPKWGWPHALARAAASRAVALQHGCAEG